MNLIHGLAADAGFRSRVDADQGLVWLWPKANRGKQPPLLLRLIVLHDGRKPIYLVTHVLEADRLSDEDARVFYAMRWRMELWFRQMKQTMGLRKLQSQAPMQARMELSWAVVGLTLLGLMQVEALIDAGKGPLEASCADGLVVVRRALRTSHTVRTRSLAKMLAHAVKDAYVRSGPKTIGLYPRKKKRLAIGKPNLLEASDADRRQYQEFMDNLGR